MKELNLKDNWNEKRKLLKRKYPNLTDEDLAYTEGKEDELFERVEQRLGISRTETRNLIRNV